MTPRLGPHLDTLRTLAGLAASTAIRSRIVAGVALVIVLAGLLLALTVRGDGSPAGQLRAFISWSLGFCELLLALSAVFLASSFAISLRRGHLLALCAGPLHRETLLVSWWLGTTAVLGVLGLLALGVVGLGAQGLLWATPPADRPAMERVLQARGLAWAERPDAAQLRLLAETQLETVVAAGKLPPEMSPEEALEQLEQTIAVKRRSVPRQRSLRWNVRGIRARPGSPVTLRFRYQFQSAQPLGSHPRVRGRFSFIPTGSDAIFEGNPRTWTAGEIHELDLGPEVLEGGENLTVLYTNLEATPGQVVFPEEGISVLYPSDGFAWNLLRAAALLVARLAFLAAVGVAAAALLDAKLAALVCFFVLALGSGHGFLLDSLRPGVFGALDGPLQGLLRGVLGALVDLGQPDLPGLLAGGERVESRAMADALILDGGLRGGLVLFAGALGFARRELGAQR